MKCVICGDPSGKRVTCSKGCLSKLKSNRATRNRKKGVGWKELILGGSNTAIPNYKDLIK